TLALSNGFVALCGALVAQYQGFSDISMGIGLILVGLASVILGQAVLGSRNIVMASLGALLGSVLYRLIIFLALRAGLDTNDMKLTTALLVVVALLLPRWGLLKRIPSLRGRGNRAASAVPQGTTDMKDPAEVADVAGAAAGRKAEDHAQDRRHLQDVLPRHGQRAQGSAGSVAGA